MIKWDVARKVGRRIPFASTLSVLITKIMFQEDLDVGIYLHDRIECMLHIM